MISVTIFSTSVLWLNSINLKLFTFQLIDCMIDEKDRQIFTVVLTNRRDSHGWSSSVGAIYSLHAEHASLFAAAYYRQVRRIVC